jgi:hypothetical protein
VSQNDNTEITAVAQAQESRLASIIEDPMKSALAATAATALAVCVVLSGIWAISASVY